MPRVETQFIPPALAADYARSLGPTTWLQNNYGSNPAARSCVRGIYPARPHQAMYPTEDQRNVRSIFKTASQNWTHATNGEVAAYFQAAMASDTWYYNFFMSRTILELIAGKDPAELPRPNAARYDLATGDGSGSVQWSTATAGTYEIEVEIESAPVIYSPGIFPFITDGLAFTAIGARIVPPPPVISLLYYHAFNPTTQERLTDSCTISRAGFDSIAAGIYRSSLILAPCICWRLLINGLDIPAYPNNFTRAPWT